MDDEQDLMHDDFAEWRLREIRAAHKRIQAEDGLESDEELGELELDPEH